MQLPHSAPAAAEQNLPAGEPAKKGVLSLQDGSGGRNGNAAPGARFYPDALHTSHPRKADEKYSTNAPEFDGFDRFPDVFSEK